MGVTVARNDLARRSTAYTHPSELSLGRVFVFRLHYRLPPAVAMGCRSIGRPPDCYSGSCRFDSCRPSSKSVARAFTGAGNARRNRARYDEPRTIGMRARQRVARTEPRRSTKRSNRRAIGRQSLPSRPHPATSCCPTCAPAATIRYTRSVESTGNGLAQLRAAMEPFRTRLWYPFWPAWPRASYIHRSDHHRSPCSARRRAQSRGDDLHRTHVPRAVRAAAGCCWVRQCNVPSPHTRSTACIPTTSRLGNRPAMIPSATRSFGSLNVGTTTTSFAM